VCGIVEGMNPKLIRSKLEAYAHSAGPKKAAKSKEAKDAKPAEAPADART
jgi:hypothetical protein